MYVGDDKQEYGCKLYGTRAEVTAHAARLGLLLEGELVMSIDVSRPSEAVLLHTIFGRPGVDFRPK